MGKRVVIKLGTSTLTHRTGRLNIRRVEKLVKIIADIQNAGNQVILVSSGSIGLGMAKLGLLERPGDTPTKQACAAVGQCELMYLYDKQFSEYSITVAQLLLTKYVLLEDRRKNVENALEQTIKMGVIPIVNENDTVAIDELELEVGENDSLAAAMPSIRLSSRRRRSCIDSLMPRAAAFLRSISFARFMSAAPLRRACAICSSASFFCDDEAFASSLLQARAFSPILSM